MLNQFSRTQLLYGEDAMEHMAKCRVAVFGIGGVGGYVVEALDTVTGKLTIVENAKKVNVPIISSMGADSIASALLER